MTARLDHLRRTAEAQHHSSGDRHGVSVKPSHLLALLDRLDRLEAEVGAVSHRLRQHGYDGYEDFWGPVADSLDAILAALPSPADLGESA